MNGSAMAKFKGSRHFDIRFPLVVYQVNAGTLVGLIFGVTKAGVPVFTNTPAQVYR